MTRLLIGISGSLGVLAIPSYLVAIKESFPNTRVIMTRSAAEFIPKETISLLIDEVFCEELPLSTGCRGHVELARWADLFIALPTTAHLLSQVASGSADTLLTATILSYKKEVIFFPNMNSAMWESKAVQRNVLTIREDGHEVVSPKKKPAFESASKKIEEHPVLPEILSVISFLKKKQEEFHGQALPV